jgi:hypothetical protein
MIVRCDSQQMADTVAPQAKRSIEMNFGAGMPTGSRLKRERLRRNRRSDGTAWRGFFALAGNLHYCKIIGVSFLPS